MRKARYQAFISSTYEDLKEERTEVAFAVLENGCFPAGMELFAASNNSQWDAIKKVIDESDFYILIIGGRYGSTETEEYVDEKGKVKKREVSYTEKEFDYALANNKPIIAFVHEDYTSLPSKKCENSVKRTRMLDNVRKKAMNGRIIKKWKNKDDLKSAAVTAITNLISNEDIDLKGWIPYEQIADEAKNIKATEKLEMMEKALKDAQMAEKRAKEFEEEVKKRASDEHEKSIQIEKKYYQMIADTDKYCDSMERFILDCSSNPSKIKSNPELIDKIKENQERKRIISEFEESDEYLQGLASAAQDCH